MAKNKDGDYALYRGKNHCGYWYKEIKDIQEIGGKPAFIVKNEDGKWFVRRGNEKYSDDFVEVSDLVGIGGKPTFKARDRRHRRYYRVYRGHTICGYVHMYEYEGWFRDIGEIQDAGGEPAFKAKRKDEPVLVGGYGLCICYCPDIGEIQEIVEVKGGFEEPGSFPSLFAKYAFKVKNKSGKYALYRCGKRCGDWYEEIGEIKYYCAPGFRARDSNGDLYEVIGHDRPKKISRKIF